MSLISRATTLMFIYKQVRQAIMVADGLAELNF